MRKFVFLRLFELTPRKEIVKEMEDNGIAHKKAVIYARVYTSQYRAEARKITSDF